MLSKQPEQRPSSIECIEYLKSVGRFEEVFLKIDEEYEDIGKSGKVDNKGGELENIVSSEGKDITKRCKMI